MSDPKKKKGPVAGAEDELGAKITDPNSRTGKPVDSFKSGSKKRGRYYDQPFDEQMYDPDARMGEDQDAPE